jgi:predicted PurR-regulated permease PerM
MNQTLSTEKLGTWTTRQVVLTTIVVVCVFFSFWLLYRLQTLILFLFISIVLGTAIRPGVDRLQRSYGVSRTTGVIIIYILIIAFLIGFLALMLPLIADQATEFSRHVPQYYSEARSGLVNSDNRLLQNIALRIPSRLSLFLSKDPTTEDLLTQVTQTVLYANLAVKGILSIMAVFLLAYYWTQESNQVVRTFIRLIPLQRRHQTEQFLYAADQMIGGYVRGQGILCLAVGTAAFISYTLIGLPYALVLGVIAGLTEMIPVFGPALGAIPALLAALSIDPQKAVWVLLATALIQAAESIWLVPRIMKNSMGVNPIIILLSLVAFSSVFGFPGALLALPLAAMLQLILNRMITPVEEGDKPFMDTEADVLALIDESKRLMDIFTETSKHDASYFDEISSEDRLEIKTIIHDLDELLQKLKSEEGGAI